MKDVLNPVMTASVPTGVYRVTMRKLLRLSMSQLQQQANLMELDVINLDQEGIAVQILINMNDRTELIQPLVHMLLAKEMATVYGIRMEVLLRGQGYPSSAVTFILKPVNMMQSVSLSRDNLLAECENQGITVNRKENKRQLATRLIVWWTAHPEFLRQPFTPAFATFLLETAHYQAR